MTYFCFFLLMIYTLVTYIMEIGEPRHNKWSFCLVLCIGSIRYFKFRMHNTLLCRCTRLDVSEEN
ncbi:hypothetical protein Hdeb2414_s0001g00023381 [Helianthus debilis subsp. tardiflorus]